MRHAGRNKRIPVFTARENPGYAIWVLNAQIDGSWGLWFFAGCLRA